MRLFPPRPKQTFPVDQQIRHYNALIIEQASKQTNIQIFNMAEEELADYEEEPEVQEGKESKDVKK